MLTDVKHRVFVYGTLKRGHRNHYLLQNADFLGSCILPGFELWDLGSYPGLRPSADPRDTVQAELYETDDETLAALDRLEDYYGPGHPRNLYDRILTADAQGTEAWVYLIRETALKTLITTRQARKIADGNYR